MKRGYPDISFRLEIVPSAPLEAGGFIPIHAPAEELLGEMQLGYRDALQIVSDLHGEGTVSPNEPTPYDTVIPFIAGLLRR